MNDRYKYRAWDNQEEKYIYGVEDGLAVMSSAGNLRILSLKEVDESERYELEQSTGKYDKNKKLIFENDLLKVKSFYGINDIKDIWKVYYSDNMSQKYMLNNLEINAELGHFLSPDIEIVGNIHENKDLLMKE